jgi:hypothetical protein
MRPTTIKTAAFAPGAISLLFALVVLATIQIANAGDFPEAAAKPARGTCAFALQLQKSVAAQREYLVKLDQARGVTEIAKNSLEEEYANIRQASLSVRETAEVAWSASEAGFDLE